MSDSRIRTERDLAHGIFAFSSNGMIEASISNSLIETTGSSAFAVELNYNPSDPDPDLESVLTIRESRIESAGVAIRFTGSDNFAGGDDLLMVGHGRTMIRGKVYFGTQGRFAADGTDRFLSREADDIDRLVFHTGPDEYIELNPARIGEEFVLEGLEFIDKTGPGWARIGTLRADGALMRLTSGDLRLGGHLDLGERGQLHILDSSRLIFEAEGYGEHSHGRITAQQVSFLPGPSGFGERKLYLADRTEPLFAGADLLVNESGAIANGATLYSESGQYLGLVLSNGEVVLQDALQPVPPAPPGDCPPDADVCIQPADPGARPVDPGNGDTGARPAEPGSGDDGDTVTQPVVPVVPVNPGPVDPVVPVFPGNPGDVSPSPCPPGVEVCIQPGPSPTPEEPATAPPQAPEPPPAEAPSERTVADARESGEPEAAIPDAGRVAETGASASDTSPDASREAPATVGLGSGSMMDLTAAALDQGSGTAGASTGLGWQTGFAAGTGAGASPGPWVRTLTATPAGFRAGGSVAGVAVGLDAELGNRFRFGTALAPAAEASSADGRSRVSGDVWTARLGWSEGGAFADAALAWGRSRARSQSVDVLTGDVLDGASGLVQSQLQATAGHRVAAGPLVAVPSVSLFVGSLEHGARTAYGAVLRTEAPGFTQGYHGWKAGLTLGTEDWLSGSGRLRWRPHLRAEWERLTDEGPETLAVRKADRAGVLSFESEERVAGLPREALRLDLGAELRGGSDAWGVGFGYSGAWTDGAPEHGVQARLSLRF